MRAFVIESASRGAVVEVPEPTVGEADVKVEVQAVGLCGTDVELFDGSMPYISQGLTRYPIRPGHEWAGRIIEVGELVADFAPGDRVVGDTFIGCNACELCLNGRHYLCPRRVELGVRGNRAGALAEYLVVPARVLHRVPAGMDSGIAALAEPGCCSLRGVELVTQHGGSLAVWGSGTLGMLAALFGRALGFETTVIVRDPAKRDWIASLGLDAALVSELDGRQFDGVVEATGAADVPQRALETTRPGGAVALLGVPGAASTLDAATVVLNDVTVFGVLGGSNSMPRTLELLGSDVDASRLIAATLGLDGVSDVLASGAKVSGSLAPKVQVDPRRVSTRGGTSR